MKSIQRHLTCTLLATVLPLALAAGALLYFIARARLLAEFDRALATEAQAIGGMVVRGGDGALEFDFAPADHPQFRPGRHAAYFEIWEPDGTVFSRSPSLAGRDLPVPPAGAAPARPRDIRLPGGPVARAAVLRFLPHTDADDHPAPVRIAPGGRGAPMLTLVLARDRHGLDETLWVINSSLLLAGLVLAGGTVLIVTLAVRRGLSPLHRLAIQADAMGAGSLGHRFSQHSMPRELQPICGKLNGLLSRLEEAFARERRFTSDAAHELRTPIAELRAMAEVALRWPGDARPEQTCRDALAIANQMEAMVASLLAIARCEAGLMPARLAPVDLAEVVREAWVSQTIASARGDVISDPEIADAALVQSDRAMLGPLVANLLSNAFAHTPPGGRIGCRVSRGESTVELAVSNTCNDLTQGDLAHLFEPFWRKDRARSGGIHCGLGLSIVAAYAQALGTTPRASLSSGMFQISLSFPSAPQVAGRAAPAAEPVGAP